MIAIEKLREMYEDHSGANELIRYVLPEMKRNVASLKTLIDGYDALHLPEFLISVNIEPTNHCQLNCDTCYRKGRSIGYMQWDTFEEACRQIYDIRTISGISLNFAGEPLLHPQFFDMVEYFAEKRNARGKLYNVVFSTNGLRPIVDALDRVDRINISLDGIGHKHEIHRRGSSWETVEANILDLLSKPRHRTKISVNLVHTDQTPEEISEFRIYWNGKVDLVIVSSYHSPEMQFQNLGDKSIRKWGTCSQLRHAAVIMWDGRVTTCCGDLLGINACGNIINSHLRDIKRKRGKLCNSCDSWMIS